MLHVIYKMAHHTLSIGDVRRSVLALGKKRKSVGQPIFEKAIWIKQ
jgi:hypothetical protein